MVKKHWKQQTRLVHEGQNRSPHGETAEAMYLTSGYVYDSAEQAEARFCEEDDGFIYSRFGNPTVRAFEERMIALEGTQDARATATGMAAVTATMMSQLQTGDHIVAARALFGSCRYVVETLMPKFGVACTLVDGRDIDAWKAAIRPETKVLFLETPSNPLLEIVDMQAVADLAHENGARLVVDNVFATPILQRPTDFGADIVVYSATKHIDGQGRSIGGAILSDNKYYEEFLKPFLRHTGPTISPFNAWILLKGIETLEYRMHQHCDNAIKVAKYLLDHPKIDNTIYPGLSNHPQFNLATKQMTKGGSVVTFTIKNDNAFNFINGLKLFDISNNLGDTKSLVTHPASTTHRVIGESGRKKLKISNNMVRLSLGLEDVEDLIEDIDHSLKLVQ